MELQGEKGPLFPLTSVRKIAPTAGLSPVERAMALQGEEGQARIFSRPPRPEKSALGTLSRPPGREKSALGHFPPVEPMLALQGREGQPQISLDRAVEREGQPRISLDRHLERNPRLALSLDRHAERNPRLATLPPVEPMLPKIFKVQNRKKKKVPTKLPSFESSRREPHFYRIARIRSERDLILAFFYRKICICKSLWVPKDASPGDASFGPKGFIESPKGKPGHAFSSLGPPPVPEFGHFSSSSRVLCVRKISPPPLSNSLRGTPRKHSRGGSEIDPSDASGGRAFGAHAAIFGAKIVPWGN